MLLTETLQLKWGKRNKNSYISKGYNFTQIGNTFNVKLEDIPIEAIFKVNVQCDYCKKEYATKYCNYITKRQELDNKDLCKSCRTRQFNLEKYGVTNVGQSEIVKQKIEKTNLEKYGTKSAWQSKEVREKIKQTTLERYGVENAFQIEEVKEKIKQKNLEKYGVTCNLNDPEVRKKAVIKSRETLYKNGKTMCSKQQKYLHDLLGGELNYPIDNCSLDIAFLNEKVYIEYDGGGHDLSVKLGADPGEFRKKEVRRKKFLECKGWKIIRIISSSDKLPSKDILINVIEEAKSYLKNNHTWFDINIDEKKIKCSKYERKINFGKLEGVR